jgi:phthiocerol/phenolphthiocerol synthesis type-I polyketide synthase A
VWQARLAPHAKPYPGYHRLHGLEVVPVSVLLQTLLTAAGELGVAGVSAVKFEQPIMLDGPMDIQVVAEGDSLRISAGSAADGSPELWTTHVTARLSRAVPSADGVAAPDQTLSDAADAPVAELLRARGVEGQPFAWSIDSYAATPSGLRARVDVDGVGQEARTAGLLDAATHIAALAGASDTRLFVPAGIEQAWMADPLPSAIGSVSVRRTGGDSDEAVVDIDASALDGALCVGLRSLRYVALVSDTAPTQRSADPRRFAHTIGWQPTTREMASPTGTTAVIGSTQVAARLRTHLADLGFATGELADARYVLYVADGEPAADGESDIDAAARMSSQLTELVRVVAQRADRYPVTLWVLTTGVREAADRAAVRQSALWGLGGVIAAEHPDLWGGVVDLAPGHGLHQTATAMAATLATPSETVLLLRDGTFLAPELLPLPDQPVRAALRCRSDAAYLITGGLGALGLLMATWLADHGAQRILLAGRHPLPPRSKWDDSGIDPQMRRRISTIRELERRGVTVDVLPIDIGSADDVRGMLAARDRLGAPPIRGIIHAAGVTRDELLAFVTDGSMREVMWPKIQGAQVLDEAFPCGSVDFFYLTSSAASVFGVAGQGCYAAANAYLDALARARNRGGCHSVSIDWAAWRGLGFAADAPIVAEELSRLGLRELAADEAFAAWEYLHRNDIAQAVVVPMSSSSGEDEAGTAPPANGASSPEAAAAWSTMPADEVRNQLIAKIRAILARELRTTESELDTDRPFIELGLNSMMAMAIRRDIESLVVLQLSATMLWNHPTVDLLAAYLTARLVPAEVPVVDNMTALAEPTEGVLDSLFDHVESASEGTENSLG